MKESLTQQQKLNTEIIPHTFAVLQTLLLILDVTTSLNIPSIVTGRKVITPFQIWIFTFSLLLILLFYIIRQKSVVEKSLFLFSVLAGLFSSLNLIMFMIDDFLVGMQITTILAIAFYLTVFAISASKILILFLLSVWRQIRKRRAWASSYSLTKITLNGSNCKYFLRRSGFKKEYQICRNLF